MITQLPNYLLTLRKEKPCIYNVLLTKYKKRGYLLNRTEIIAVMAIVVVMRMIHIMHHFDSIIHHIHIEIIKVPMQSIKKLCENLNLPYGDQFTQDWAYELPDQYRTKKWLDKYISAYLHNGYSSTEKKRINDFIS